jgi:hypothetical protein
MAPIRLVLPPALPARYLSWMAFWREVERKMVESPKLADMAAEAMGIDPLEPDLVDLRNAVLASLQAQIQRSEQD